ncbi:hypothetical protein KW508_07905 [Vibrio fluvialis]|nr:hypothetical protein [Vibrio fluvialis]
MNVNELWSFTVWLVETIKETHLVQILEDTINLKQKSNSNNQNQINQKVRDDLLSTFEEIPVRSFNESEREILRNVHLDNVFNDNPTSYVNELYDSNAYSFQQQISQLAKTKKALSDALSRSATLNSSLTFLMPDNNLRSHNEPSDIETPTLRLIFKKEANIDNIVELKDWSDKLYSIIRGITISQNLRAEDCKILDTGKGSHWFDLALDPSTIKIICEAVDYIAITITKCFGAASAFKAFQLASIKVNLASKELEQIEQQLKTQNELLKAEFLASEVARLTEEHKLEKQQNNELRSALKKLYELMEKGAEWQLNNIPDDNEEFRGLKHNLEDSLLLISEEKQRLELEYKSEKSHNE